MQTLQSLFVFLIVTIILIVLFYQDAKALPDMTPQDLYKQSDMVFYGKIITKESGPGPDYYYYQVKVETYFKNPQTSDSITVAGHKPSGGHMAYPQFEVGDRAIFYINKLDGINTLSPYSQQSDSACGLSSFGLDIPPQNSGIARGGFLHEMRILDSAGNAVSTIQINQPLLIRYDDFVNGLPEARTVTATLAIQKYNDTQPVFYQKQDIPMIACSFAPKPHWNFTPVVSGHYAAMLTYDNQTITTDFNVRNNLSTNVIDKAMSLSPLKQFKQNKDSYSIDCGQNLLLVISKSSIPICVKETTATKLWNRGWVSKSTDFYAKYTSPDVLEKFQSKIISSQRAIQIVQDYIKENNIKLNVDTTSPKFTIITSLNYEVLSSNYNNMLDVDSKTGIPIQVMAPWTIYYKNPQWWSELEKYYLGMNSNRIESGNLVWHVDYRECTECIVPYPFFLVDAITGKIVLAPNGMPEKTSIVENKTSPVLKLSMSIDNQYASPAQPINIYVSLNNTSSDKLTLVSTDNWPRDDLSMGPCSTLPFGLAILKGYYTEQNMSNARSLALYGPLPCPFSPKIKSYTFEPLSSKATQECDSLFSCTGPVDMKAHLEMTGFIYGDNPHHQFDVGTYTIVVGDQWGDVITQHFSEAYATAYDKNLINENKNGSSSAPKVTGLEIHSRGGSIRLGPNDLFNETEYYAGNVGNVITGLPVHVSISNPYDMFTREYDIPSSSIMPDGSFNFTHTFLGKFGQDTYTLDFTYGNQKHELKFIPVVPP